MSGVFASTLQSVFFFSYLFLLSSSLRFKKSKSLKQKWKKAQRYLETGEVPAKTPKAEKKSTTPSLSSPIAAPFLTPVVALKAAASSSVHTTTPTSTPAPATISTSVTEPIASLDVAAPSASAASPVAGGSALKKSKLAAPLSPVCVARELCCLYLVACVRCAERMGT